MSTIVLFLSLEAIQIAYTDAVDPETQVFLEEKLPNQYTVVREGIKIRNFLMQMLKLKEDEMAEEEFPQLASPVLVCLSGKSRSYAQRIFEKLSPQLQRHLIYYKIDKNAYKDYPFNRAVLEGNEICYGEGFSQLRAKEEMRIAFFSLLGNRMKDCIFLEKTSEELKDLKKEGYEYLLEDFNVELLNQMVHKIRSKPNIHSQELLPPLQSEIIAKFDFASQYLKKFQQQYKSITLKNINPFNTSQLGIKGLISQLHRSSTSYNLSPKSWVQHNSKEISAYIFHNIADQRLYVARAVKPKDFTNQEDFQVKILAQYLSHIIDPQAFTVPHDRHSFLMKFSKIKVYENKKAIMNIRPYVEKLVTISELGLPAEELVRIFREGRLWGQKVNGVAGVLLMSWLINDNLKAKSLSEQLAFLSVSKMDGQIAFVSSSNLKESEQLFICRTDFHSIFNMSTFKTANPQLTISNYPPVKLTFDQLHPQIISELIELIYNLRDQRMALIRSLVLYYGWQTKLVHLYEVITYRLELMRSMVREEQAVTVRGQMLRDIPELAALLIQQDYSYFMLPSPTIYSPVDYSIDAPYEPGKIPQNPYLAYLSKTCSFGIFNLHFPVLTYLQWLKSTSKYQIIEYISMLNNTTQGYKTMDLRLKQQVVNEKKSAILIVDHVELCEELVEKAKSIKTVLIFRLRKTVQIENLGMITEQTRKEDDLPSSSDELIKVLWREGLRQFGEDNQFQLIDWILTSYIKTKCQMYDLPLNEVLAFLPILHRAISTNKHRIKEIKEIYPNQYKYLYAYPIVKQSQKVQFAHHLFEFLHVKYLFANILSGQWGNRLQTYQNNSLLFCRKLIDATLAVRVVERLLEDLRSLEERKAELFDYQYQCGEILQLVRSLTETGRAEEEQHSPYSLYFEVFPKIQKIFNFNLLKRVVQNDNCLVVEDQEAVYFYVDHQNQPIRVLQKRNSQQILSMSLGEDRILRVLSLCDKAAVVECYLLGSEDELEESKSHPTSTLISTVEVKHSIIEQYLLSGQQTQGEILLGWLQNCHCIILPAQLRVMLVLVSPQTGESFIRSCELASPLLKLSFGHSQTQLLCVTEDSIQLIPLHPEAATDPLSTVPLHRSLPSNFKLQVDWSDPNLMRVWLSEGTMLQCVSLTCRGELQSRCKFELPFPLKAVSVAGEWVLAFAEGSDCLEILRVEGGFAGGLGRYRQYYSVEANCGDILVGRTAVYLRGGQHYLKKIQLPALSAVPRP